MTKDLWRCQTKKCGVSLKPLRWMRSATGLNAKELVEITKLSQKEHCIAFFNSEVRAEAKSKVKSLSHKCYYSSYLISLCFLLLLLLLKSKMLCSVLFERVSTALLHLRSASSFYILIILKWIFRRTRKFSFFLS